MSQPALAGERLRVLCVDDEPAVLEGLELTLGRDYEVCLAEGGEAALGRLADSGPFAVVLSDMRMPGMSGAELLSQVRRRAPDAGRMLLTGYADVESAVAAVNQGEVFRYLSKPCAPNELRSSVQAAVTQYRLRLAERELLEKTLRGCVEALSEAMSLADPVLFGQARRVRELSLQLATAEALPPSWVLEVSALLRNLGWVGLPREVVARELHGETITPAERQRLQASGTRTLALLGHVPRLEPVCDLLRLADSLDGIPGEVPDIPLDDSRLQQAEILNFAQHYALLECRGHTPEVSLRQLRTRHPEQAARLATLSDLLGVGDSADGLHEVQLAGLEPGMRLAQPMVSVGGQLLAPAGYEITEAFVERIKYLRPGLVKLPLQVHLP